MIDLKSRPLSLISNWDLLKGLLETFGPHWLQSLRERSIEEFASEGIPTHKDEEFKYLSMRALEEVAWKPAYGATVDRYELSQMPLGNLDAITVAFVNGEYAPNLSSAHALPAGVYVGPLWEAYDIYPEVVDKHLTRIASLDGKLGSTNDERFVHLNSAYLGEGAFVYVPKNVALDIPVHLIYLTKADHHPMASFPRNLIVLEEGAEAKVLESYIGMDGVYFSNCVSELSLGRSAILEHTKHVGETEDAIHVATTAVSQAAESTFTSNVACLGGKIVRNDLNVFVGGEHCETWLNGVAVGLGHQLVDNHTRIDHAMPNCHSFEVYKSILGGSAQGVFNGKIFVYEDAQKTDAKQSNQALLLSPRAAINTKPQLEIFADDVKCTHGATVGQLREDALFYLRARGIPLAQARSLLVYAFAAEVLERVSIPEVRDSLEHLLFGALRTDSEDYSAD